MKQQQLKFRILLLALGVVVGSYLDENLCQDYEFVDKMCKDLDAISSFRIINGEQSSVEEWPYLVSIQLLREPLAGCFAHFCGGTLIAPDMVLTAAHCLTELRPPWAKQGVLNFPVFVALAPKCRHDVGYGRIQIQRYFVHPNYDVSKVNDDIAILQLQDGYEGVYSGTLMNYRAAASEDTSPGQKVKIGGWGNFNSTDELPNLKQYARRPLSQTSLSIISEEECRTDLGVLGSLFYEEKMLCAFNATSDSCKGDSGGPLILRKSNGYGSTQDVQVGIVSWGPGSACDNLGRQEVGVYTKVANYVDWIDEVIANNSQFQGQVQNELQSEYYLLAFEMFSENEDFELPMVEVEQSDEEQSVPTSIFFESFTTCVSRQGCECKRKWSYLNKTALNCNNPDNDPQGTWCIVDLDSCPDSATLGSIVSQASFYDRCDC